MRISIDLPDNISREADDPAYLKEALIATLYRVGRISEKEARGALGMTRREFQELLPRFGFSVLAGTEDDVHAELNA